MRRFILDYLASQLTKVCPIESTGRDSLLQLWSVCNAESFGVHLQGPICGRVSPNRQLYRWPWFELFCQQSEKAKAPSTTLCRIFRNRLGVFPSVHITLEDVCSSFGTSFSPAQTSRNASGDCFLGNSVRPRSVCCIHSRPLCRREISRTKRPCNECHHGQSPQIQSKRL